VLIVKYQKLLKKKMRAQHIVVFKKINNTFPTKDSIVAVNASTIESHVDEINKFREPELLAKMPICTRFAHSFQLNGLFYTTELEKSKLIKDAEIAVKVNELIVKSKTIDAVCDLRLLLFADDIEKTNTVITLDANDLQVIQPVICDNVFIYESLDYVCKDDEFELLDANRACKRIYKENKRLTGAMNDAAFEAFLLDYGIKSFSLLILQQEMFNEKLDILLQNDTKKEESSDIRDLHNDVLQITSTQEFQDMFADAMFDTHPLKPLAERLTEEFFAILSKHRCSTEAIRQDVVDMMRIMISRADISIEIYDEE